MTSIKRSLLDITLKLTSLHSGASRTIKVIMNSRWTLRLGWKGKKQWYGLGIAHFLMFFLTHSSTYICIAHIVKWEERNQTRGDHRTGQEKLHAVVLIENKSCLGIQTALGVKRWVSLNSLFHTEVEWGTWQMSTYLKPFIVTVVCFIGSSVINHSSVVPLAPEVLLVVRPPG